MFGFLSKHEGVAVRHQHGTLSFAEFNRVLALLGNRLEEEGIAPEDRLALILPNSLEFLAGYYACLLKGHVAVPINERLTLREMGSILGHSRPRGILTSPSMAERLERAGFQGSGAGAATTIIPVEGLHAWPDGFSDAPERPVPPSWPADHPAILFYTSGSTGTPKGALYSHRTLRENCRVYGGGMGITGEDHSVLCHCMASNFVFAQVAAPVLDAGGTVHIVDFGSVDQTLKAIQEGATFLSLIPWFGFQLARAARERPPNPNRLRACAVGGDRVPSDFFSDFERAFGIVPREHLGMTETNVYCCNPPFGGGMRLGSVGRAFPEVNIQVRGTDGFVLPSGQEGEIWVRTPGAMEGYWEDPERSREVMAEGWIATGDSGRLDSDGYLWYAGRIKQIIICDGDNIHPKEVELEIARHPLVAHACVVGIPHPTRGETVGAAVTLKDPNAPFDLEDLKGFLRPRLTDVKLPTSLLTMAEFPAMPNGKIDRRAILEALKEAGSRR